MGKESLFLPAVLIPEWQMIDGCATDGKPPFLPAHERSQLLGTDPSMSIVGMWDLNCGEKQRGSNDSGERDAFRAARKYREKNRCGGSLELVSPSC